MPPKYRDIVKLLEEGGRYLPRQRGSHRQYEHPMEPGPVTVPGKLRAHAAEATYRSILEASGVQAEQAGSSHERVCRRL